ncbi:hypothetical protein CR513_54472, partial [Mucuna pruriens]
MDLLLSLINNTFQVNGHQIKLFHEDRGRYTVDVENISLMEPCFESFPLLFSIKAVSTESTSALCQLSRIRVDLGHAEFQFSHFNLRLVFPPSRIRNECKK